MAACRGDGLPRVDAATVERAWRELSTAAGGTTSSPRHAAITEDEADAAPPRVRVVRRLWG
ncbi:MAG: hypothetical protein EBX36_10735 [Planctomycetia bacterium]|nr:hypothetical protein [Planctomycetia bacterium]